MALEGLFQESAISNNDLYEVELSAKNWNNSVSANVMGTDRPPSPGLDCNICLDFVQDPVVTLCGHLYCWPCIYKWLSLRSASSEYSESDQPEPQCPVCKSLISESTLVPLYGRGKPVKTSDEKASDLDLAIPPRPAAPVSWHMVPAPPNQTSGQRALHPNHFNQPQLRHRDFISQPQPYYLHSPSVGFRGFHASSNSVHPVVGMFGQMVYGRMFGNSIADIHDYPYIREQQQHMNPRLRRQVMQADKSLNRICFFLFCCIVLCLVLF